MTDIGVGREEALLSRKTRFGESRAVGTRLAEAGFLLPAFVLVALVVLLPSIYALYYSFFNWSPGYPSPYVGFQNYSMLLGSANFREVLGNEAFYLIGVPIWTAIPLAVAIFLFERVKFAGLVRSVMLFPAIVAPAILALFFRAILQPDGLLNSTLRSVGLGSLRALWVDDPALVKPVVIVVLTWASMGIGVLIFTAALSSVPPELFEAAELDGANWWRRLRDVAVPGIAPVIIFYVVLQVLTVFLGLFPWVYVLTNGGPGYASTSIDFDIYTRAFTGSVFGQAAAESVLLVVIVAALGLVAWLASRLWRRARR